jgi:hypothetical protein
MRKDPNPNPNTNQAQGYEYMYNDHLGNVCCCPSNLGTEILNLALKPPAYLTLTRTLTLTLPLALTRNP